MKISELFESRPGDKNTPAWYIVRVKDDAISSGPYDSRKEAAVDTRRLQWYNEHEFDIAHGIIDDDSDNKFDTFKEVKSE